jgi:hypothetical protein
MSSRLLALAAIALGGGLVGQSAGAVVALADTLPERPALERPADCPAPGDRV